MTCRWGELDVLGDDDVLGENVEGLNALQVNVDAGNLVGKATGSRCGLGQPRIAIELRNSPRHGDGGVQAGSPQDMVCHMRGRFGFSEV